MPKLTEAFVDITARTDKLKKGLRGAQTTTKRSVGRMTAAFTALKAAIAAAGVAAAAFAGVRFLSRLTATADRVDKISKRLGIGTQALQELRFAGRLAGLQTRQLENALQRVQRRIASAAKGTGEAVDALKELGLNAVELAKLAPEEQLQAVADSLKDLSAGDRLRILQKIGDIEGTELAQAIGTLRAGRAEAGALGIGLSARSIESLVDLADNIFRITSSLRDNVANSLVRGIERANAILENILQFVKDNLIQTRTAINIITNAPSLFGSAFNVIGPGIIIPTPGKFRQAIQDLILDALLIGGDVRKIPPPLSIEGGGVSGAISTVSTATGQFKTGQVNLVDTATRIQRFLRKQFNVQEEIERQVVTISRQMQNGIPIDAFR